MFDLAPGEKSAASPKQTTSEHEKHEDLELVLMEERRRTEQVEMKKQDVIQVED